MTGNKPIGSRWRFRSVHWSVVAFSEQPCVIVDTEAHPWPYTVQFDNGKRATALDRDLVERIVERVR